MKSANGMFRNILLIIIISITACFCASVLAENDSDNKEQASSAVVEEVNGEDAIEKTDKIKIDNPNKKEKESEEDSAENQEPSQMTAISSMESGSGSSGGAGGSVISSISIPEPSVFTGSVASTIPIIVPPGRGGIAPNLSLNYNSSGKNGWIGVGWTLDMGTIQRSTKDGLDCDGDDYIATANGSASELVSLGNGNYVAKVEGAFTKYRKMSDDRWEVTTKDGTTYKYGSTADSKQNCESGTFIWYLDEVRDTNGNTMTVTYDDLDVADGSLYLKRITYTGPYPTNYVEFHFTDREDSITSYASHLKTITNKLLPEFCT